MTAPYGTFLPGNGLDGRTGCPPPTAVNVINLPLAITCGGEANMASLTYNIFTGVLVAVSQKDGTTIIAHAESGGSSFWWDSIIRQRGKHGSPGHTHGGPIPPGRWHVWPPGEPHPDGGKLRPNWIPVGPLTGTDRTLIYIHSLHTNTEGCIAVDNKQGEYDKIYEMVKDEGGGTLTVLMGSVAVGGPSSDQPRPRPDLGWQSPVEAAMEVVHPRARRSLTRDAVG